MYICTCHAGLTPENCSYIQRRRLALDLCGFLYNYYGFSIDELTDFMEYVEMLNTEESWSQAVADSTLFMCNALEAYNAVAN